MPPSPLSLVMNERYGEYIVFCMVQEITDLMSEMVSASVKFRMNGGG
jgi:hypothetical protein